MHDIVSDENLIRHGPPRPRTPVISSFLNRRLPADVLNLFAFILLIQGERLFSISFQTEKLERKVALLDPRNAFRPAFIGGASTRPPRPNKMPGQCQAGLPNTEQENAPERRVKRTQNARTLKPRPNKTP